MKRFTTLLVALGFATAGSTALAEQAKDQVISKQNAKPQPVQMTETQLDNVAAGQLIEVNVIDVANGVQVAVPIHAQAAVNAAAGVLGNAVAGQAARFGRSNTIITNP